MNFKRMLGYSAWLGNRRRLDELLGHKEEYEYAVEHKQRDWKECEKCLPSIYEEIERVREKIMREDNWVWHTILMMF